MAEGFNFTKIVVVQSLEQHESQTGRMIADFLTSELESNEHLMQVEFKTCWSAKEFLEVLTTLEYEANTGEIPLLHVETHGSKEMGLEFENGSELSWDDLAKLLRRLNVATRFNLLALFSACWGGYFLGKMSAIQQAPCYAMVAPSEKLWPNEIYAGFTTFYRIFLKELDVASAVDAMRALPLQNGYWFGKPAEIWFERVLLDYVRVKCSNEMSEQRAKTLQSELAKDGKIIPIPQLLELLRGQNRKNLLPDYFSKYFMLEEIPENATRFSALYTRMEFVLDELRSGGQHVV